MGVSGVPREQSLALGRTEGKASAAQTRGLTEPPTPSPAAQEQLRQEGQCPLTCLQSQAEGLVAP